MKIGFVIDDHMGRPGGVQEYVRGLRNELIRQGHTVVIFTGGAGPDEAGIIPLGSSLPLRGSGSSTSIPLTLATPARLRGLLAQHACDVLHVMAPYSPTLSGRLLVQSRAVHVMTFLVAIEPAWYLRMLSVLARLQQRSLARFHARIAISRAAEHSARSLYGGCYHLIPVGVDIARWKPPADPCKPRAASGMTILSVGRLEQRKGVAHLLRAVARLQGQQTPVRLVIGGDGPERAALERLAADLKLRDAEFVGYVAAAELPRLFHRADVFCAPATFAESFGIVLVEALAAGLPIVAAANAGYAEVLAAHPGNLLVPPGDDRALAGALQIFADAPVYRATLGKRNVVDAQRYSWRTVSAAIMDVYQAALAE